jgi:transposase
LRNEYLGAENRILRGQIKRRLLLSEGEKAALAEIAHRLGRKALEELAAVAKPDTLLAWYRKLIANKFDGCRLMLLALAEGIDTAQEMAQLAKKQLRKKIPELQLALEGKVEEHHRFLLGVQLDRLRAVERDLEIVEQRIQEKLKPYAAELLLLDDIPGVDAALAAAIIAELGVDMRVFENVSQLASWAGVCPGNNESAGKRRRSRIPKGNMYLKTTLIEAANAAAKAKGTYLRSKFYRLKARRGYKRAAVAVAHKILVAIHMLSHRVCYNELGDLYLDNLNRHHLTRNLVHRLERLGYTVTIQPTAA